MDNEEEILLRRILATVYCGILLYADDEELIDNIVQPHIDFNRDSTSTILQKIQKRGQNSLQKMTNLKV